MLGLTLALTITLGAQAPTPVDRTLTLIVDRREVSIKESAARAEYNRLVKAGSINTGRLVGLAIALGTTPAQPRCTTWEQHVAEVTSWWAAPEREYVDCNDPRVRPKN